MVTYEIIITSSQDGLIIDVAGIFLRDLPFCVMRGNGGQVAVRMWLIILHSITTVQDSYDSRCYKITQR